MSDSEQDGSVLGKRSRNNQLSPPKQEPVPTPEDAGADDDDDVGPMPMPADDKNGSIKKKRKGMLFLNHFLLQPTEQTILVLPHEKLYLEHLPAADRYYKSFMHRDAINFNVITK
jgi:peptidylprolyl isomerase domain and WD repeat-containing protein 1